MESLAADNKRLQEEIARLEKEKESEPVSKLHLCFYGGILCFIFIFYIYILNFILLTISELRYLRYVTNGKLFSML